LRSEFKNLEIETCALRLIFAFPVSITIARVSLGVT